MASYAGMGQPQARARLTTCAKRLQMQQMTVSRIAFFASKRPEARAALPALQARYGICSEEEADVVVALGGDGAVLDTLRRRFEDGKPVYGMNLGTIGFLMNDYALMDCLNASLPPRKRISTRCE